MASSQCGPGQECNGGLCANSIATATAFSLCGLDADCPAGDFCELSVCTHQCVSDRDCADGRVCDVRGQCQSEGALGEPSPAQVPTADSPVLALDVISLELSTLSTPGTLSVRNTSTQAMKVRVLSDSRWLTASPASATVAPRSSVDVAVQTVPGVETFGETRATLRVLSSGGSATVPVTVPARLDGMYRGSYSITSPIPLGVLPLSLLLVEDELGGVSGVVEAEHSPALGFRAAVSGQRAADGTYTLGFQVPAAAGSRANPDLGQAVLREVRLTLAPAGYQALTGSYQEVLTGPLQGPARVEGGLELRRVGNRKPLAAETASIQLLPPAPASWAETCTTCPSGAACPSGSAAADVEAGMQFLAGALPLYGGFTTEGYQLVSRCMSSSSECFNAGHLVCAQKRFFAALGQGPSGDVDCTGLTGGSTTVSQCATRGLLDTFKGFLHWRLLQGNEYLVRANAWGAELPHAQLQLDAARSSLLYALVRDPRSTASPRTPLEPFMLRWLEGLSAGYMRGAHRTLLPERLAIQNTPASYLQAGVGEDLLQPLEALATFARAAAQAAALQHRADSASGNSHSSAALAQRATASTFLQGALLGTLLSGTGAASRAGTRLGESLSRLAGQSEVIANGFNPAGVSDEMVPYIFDPRAAGVNNFLQMEAFPLLPTCVRIQSGPQLL
jgi:hypothetical protein